MQMKLIYRLMVVCAVATMSLFSTQAKLENYSKEERAIVTENNTDLGYIKYKNDGGKIVVAYYDDTIEIEKMPYSESYDRIGYIDQLFPNFEFDSLDGTLEDIKSGDSVYLTKDKDGYISYIRINNDYTMRYGKIQNISNGIISLIDDNNKIYTYNLSDSIITSKGNKVININSIKPGEYARVLIEQRLLGAGVIEEEALEIVVDNNSRFIENIYSGEILNVDSYRNVINLNNYSVLGKKKWDTSSKIYQIAINNKMTQIYAGNKLVSTDYVNRYMRGNKAYIAIENNGGTKKATKINLNSGKETIIPSSEIVYTSPGTIRLLNGETLKIDNSTILIKDKRIVDLGNVFIGDKIKAVVCNSSNLVIADITTNTPSDKMQVFRGRIKEINDSSMFTVETFSMLENNIWYFHTQPRTFSIDKETKVYNESGLVSGGIDNFLTYGENTQSGGTYTIFGVADKAVAIVDMPYTINSLKGEVYKVDTDKVYVKDVQYFDSKQGKWVQHSSKNIGVSVVTKANTLATKNGEIVKTSSLVKGDTITVMSKENLKDLTVDKNVQPSIDGYLIIIE